MARLVLGVALSVCLFACGARSEGRSLLATVDADTVTCEGLVDADAPFEGTRCIALGELLRARVLAPEDGEDRVANAVVAAKLLWHACRDDEARWMWRTCESAFEMMLRTGQVKPRELLMVLRRARAGAQEACLRDGAGCEFAISTTTEPTMRARLLIGACRDRREADASAEDVFACVRAREGGVDPRRLEPLVWSGTVDPPVPMEPSTTMDELRESGATQVHPTRRQKQIMYDHGLRQVAATFKYGVSTGGRVYRVELLWSSGVPSYDRRLMETIYTWRFEPYRVDGEPSPVISTVSFVYHMGEQGPLEPAWNQRDVSPDELRGVIREAGPVPAPAWVRDQARADGRSLVVEVRVCPSHNGRVAMLELLRSSGYEDFDDLVLGVTSAWRFQPLATPRCAVFTFP